MEPVIKNRLQQPQKRLQTLVQTITSPIPKTIELRVQKRKIRDRHQLKDNAKAQNPPIRLNIITYQGWQKEIVSWGINSDSKCLKTLYEHSNWKEQAGIIKTKSIENFVRTKNVNWIA